MAALGRTIGLCHLIVVERNYQILPKLARAVATFAIVRGSWMVCTFTLCRAASMTSDTHIRSFVMIKRFGGLPRSRSMALTTGVSGYRMSCGFIGGAVTTGRCTVDGIYLVVIKRQNHRQPSIVTIVVAG
jgi:hypothetical protein